jgi:hypothetical protein
MEQTVLEARHASLERARAVRTLGKQHRWANEMRSDGWTVLEPGRRDEILALLGTMDLHAIAETLRAVGQEERGAWELEQLVKLSGH